MPFSLRRRDEPPARRPIPTAAVDAVEAPANRWPDEAPAVAPATRSVREPEAVSRVERIERVERIDRAERVERTERSEARPAPVAADARPAAAEDRPRRSAPPPSPPPSVISADSMLEGRLRFAGPLHVDGSVEGSVEGPSIFVGPTGRIDGGLLTEELRLDGRMRGEIRCDRAAVGATARIQGHVVCTTMTLARGAMLEGQVWIGQREGAQDAKP